MAVVVTDLMFPDRCDVYAGPPIPDRATRDPSGGRPADPEPPTPTLADVRCSIQSATPEEIVNANVLGFKVNTKVYFKASPGDLRTGARLVPTLYNGVAPARVQGLSVQFVNFNQMPPLAIWCVFCMGRD